MLIDELLMSATRLRGDAQELRRKAREEKSPERDRLFELAEANFQKAINGLERGLRTMRRQQRVYSPDVCRILEALSQSYGSLGGTLRDAGKLTEALKQYEQGNVYEEERRIHCNALDTYNLLQSLVVQLLIPPPKIADKDFQAKLDQVRREIQRQVDAGRKDSWALADLALASFLQGLDADSVIAEIERNNANIPFYESTYNVLKALVDEGLGKGEPLGERLDAFRRLVQRKGGIR